MRHQVPFGAGCIGIMARGTVKRGMHQPHVALARHRSRIIGKEALRHMGRIKGEAMESRAADLDRWCALVQQMDVRPQISMRLVI